LTVGKTAYTTSGAVVEIVAQDGDKVTVKDAIFGSEFETDLGSVYHSRNMAWGAMREV
jgi:hypothetical protein